MKRNKMGFTIIEVISTMVIIVIITSSVLWNLTGIRHMTDIHQEVHRATIITTAKEVWYKDLGYSALKQYQNAKNDADRFQFLLPYLPYANPTTTLLDYTPEGFEYSLNRFNEKVSIMDLETKQKIEY